MGRTTHPRDMHPVMRDAQLRAGLLCINCGGLGETTLSHGISHEPSKIPCVTCGGTGRKKET